MAGRKTGGVVLAAFFMGAVCGPCFAADEAPPPTGGAVAADETFDREMVHAIVEKGLGFLASQQSPELGAVGKKYPVAVTALTGLAFLGAGYGYNRGKYGRHIARCVEYLLRSADSESYPGFIAKAGEDHPMHGHGYALLFLTQVYGELPVPQQKKVKRVIERGIQVISSAISFRGGWYYYADNAAHQDENSVTVCVLQALRAARNIGLLVEKELIDRAVVYLKKCQNPDGSFRYSLSGNVKWSSYELTAGAVASLQLAGKYDGEEVRKGIDYMKAKLGEKRENPLAAAQRYHYYGNLYAAQVFYQGGEKMWRNWHSGAFQCLLKQREAGGGHWESPFGDAYATAVAVLIFEVPLGFLPIFQR